MKPTAQIPLLDQVRRLLHAYLSGDDRVVIAVSGGPDSMVLLDVCRHVLGQARITAAHFNHQVRQESGIDEGIVRDYCRRHGIALVLGSADIPRKSVALKKGLEETGRMERYAFLEAARTQVRARYVLTAHHADDQVETILLHFIRGSGIHGLTGMPVLSGTVLRPLLSIPKQQLLSYAKAKRIRCATDATNLVPDTSRNLLRLQGRALLEKINPSLGKTLLHGATLLADLAAFLSDEAEAFLSACSSSQGVDQGAFADLPVALQREVLRKLYIEAHGSAEGLYSAELEEVRRFFLTSVTGKRKAFGKRLLLRTSKKRIASQISA